MFITLGKRYRILSTTLALVPDGRGRKLGIIISEGGVVEVVDEPTQGSRLVNVRWKGTPCEMFIQDLRDRGEDMDYLQPHRDTSLLRRPM